MARGEVGLAGVDDVLGLSPSEHCVIVAGPGTGKSWRIAQRAQALVDRGECQADDIVVLTLTQSAARKLEEEVPFGRAGTFHSYSRRHLNAIGDAPRKRIVDGWEEKHLVIPDLQALYGPSHPRADAIAKFLIHLGAGFRANQSEPPDLTATERRLREGWLVIREFYQFRLFDELAYDLLRRLEEGSELRSPPRTILVDEYQDLTPSELALLKTVADRHGTGIFACGDDRQSIFGFREADPLGLNNFCSVYGIESPVFLNVTRRCPDVICSYAEAVASQIPSVPGLSDRPPLSAHESLRPGTLQISSFPSPTSESRGVDAAVAKFLDGGSPNREVMVIVPYGVNLYTNSLNEASASSGSGIRYFNARSSDEVCDTPEFRALYSFVRLASDPKDLLAVRSLLFLARGWGPAFFKKMLASGSAHMDAAINSLAALDPRVAAFTANISSVCGEVQLARSCEDILTSVGLWFQQERGLPPAWDAVLSLPEMVALEAQQAEEDPFVQGLLDPLSSRINSALLLATSARKSERPLDAKEVGVYTPHQAKGLQADHVFVVGAFTQAFLDANSPADGVRRLYVAVTRSKRSLSISVGRYVRGKQLGRMLEADSVELSPHVKEAARRVGIDISWHG